MGKRKGKKKKILRRAIKIKSIIIDLVADEGDIERFLNGTNVAGTRIRKASMEIQKLNKDMRDEVTKIRNKRKKKKNK